MKYLKIYNVIYKFILVYFIVKMCKEIYIMKFFDPQ